MVAEDHKGAERDSSKVPLKFNMYLFLIPGGSVYGPRRIFSPFPGTGAVIIHFS